MSYPSFLKGFVVGTYVNISNAANSTITQSGVDTVTPLNANGGNPFDTFFFQAGARRVRLNKEAQGGKGMVVVDEIMGSSDVACRFTFIKLDAGNAEVTVKMHLVVGGNTIATIKSSPVAVKPNKEQTIPIDGFHGGIDGFYFSINSSVAGDFQVNGVYIKISEIIS